MSGIERFIELSSSSHRDVNIQKHALRNIVTAEIHELIERNGISQIELAKKLGCTKSHISRLLSGDRNFTIDTLSKIANSLNYHVSILFLPSVSRVGLNWDMCIGSSAATVTFQSSKRGSSDSFYVSSSSNLEASSINDRSLVSAS